MGRCPLSEESGVKKGPWTPEEDDKLINYIHKHGHGSWRALPKLAGLNRCGKSCRLRWTNYLRPDIKRGKFSQDEEQTILNLHAILGNKWSAIATHLPGRTDNEIKNFWNTHLKKKLIQMGFDPMTHRPRTDIFSTLPHLMALFNLIDNPASWDDQLIRLQAEAVQMARLNHCLTNLLQPPLVHASILDSSATAPPSFPEALFLQETTPFSHLPDLQAPCSNNNMIDESKLGVMVQGDFVGVVNQEENSPACSSPWMQPAAVETNSITNTQLDACSSSSYGGTAHIWSELFDDPIFQEIA